MAHSNFQALTPTTEGQEIHIPFSAISAVKHLFSRSATVLNDTFNST